MMALLQDADLTEGLECVPGCHVAIRAAWQLDRGDPHTGAMLSIQASLLKGCFLEADLENLGAIPWAGEAIPRTSEGRLGRQFQMKIKLLWLLSSSINTHTCVHLDTYF